LPRLSRWFIRTALVYLLVSLMVGVAQPSLTSAGLILWPTSVHLLVVGWLTQLIFGVAYWMFPRQRAASSLWPEHLGWLAYGSLNAGLVLRAIAESGPLTASRSAWFLLSALLQLIAGWSFVIATWPRVRGR
jgi:hypothetical protein